MFLIHFCFEKLEFTAFFKAVFYWPEQAAIYPLIHIIHI